MIVVTLIALLAAIAVPGFARIQQESRKSTIINDYRVFADAFDTFNTQVGAWPADGMSGVIPLMMGEYLDGGEWQSETVVGGNWDWEFNTVGIEAGVSVTNPSVVDPAFWINVDRNFDQTPDLGAGRFQFLAGDRYTLILAGSS